MEEKASAQKAEAETKKRFLVKFQQWKSQADLADKFREQMIGFGEALGYGPEEMNRASGTNLFHLVKKEATSNGKGKGE